MSVLLNRLLLQLALGAAFGAGHIVFRLAVSHLFIWWR